MKYDIMAAIALRSEGLWDETKGYNVAVDLKTSIDLAKDHSFIWDFYYPGEAIMQLVIARDKGEKTNKEFWKNISHSHRLYLRQMSDAADAGPYGYIK